MPEVFANNASSTLSAGIASGALAMTLAAGDGALFPVLAGSDYFYATLEEGSTREIVKVTARASDVCTIVRAQQGTSASAFTTAATVEQRITKGTLESLQSSSLIHQASVTIAHADILTLPTIPVDLVPAYATGRLVFQSAFGLLDATAGAYTIAADASLLVMTGSGSYVGSAVRLQGANGSAFVHALSWIPWAKADGVAGDFSTLVTGSLLQQESLLNTPLQLKDDWAGVSNYSGGHADNTLDVTCEFRVYDATLKRFLTQAESGWNGTAFV